MDVAGACVRTVWAAIAHSYLDCERTARHFFSAMCSSRVSYMPLATSNQSGPGAPQAWAKGGETRAS